MADPLRVSILNEGAKLTSGDRDKSYGDPLVNLGLAGQIKDLCRRAQARSMHPAEVEALDQVITKIARCYTGPVVKQDNYVDGATYFAIAGEAATRHLEAINEQVKPAPFKLDRTSDQE
jgi:hypothetical protein